MERHVIEWNVDVVVRMLRFELSDLHLNIQNIIMKNLMNLFMYILIILRNFVNLFMYIIIL